MTDPITLASLTIFVAKNAPSWLTALHDTILDKGQDPLIEKGEDFVLTRGKQFTRRIFHLDEKEQLRHLEQALKNATERGLATFVTSQERELYRDVLKTLSQPGPMGETLRQETMQMFTLLETPDLTALTDTYNRRKRFYDEAHLDIDAGPYLKSFFDALLGELYADLYFRPQLSEALQLRAAQSMQQSLSDIIDVLCRIGETLEGNYDTETFVHDIDVYTAYVERTLHNLKIIGVVPKDQNTDPELSGIFVPLLVHLREPGVDTNLQPDTLVSTLEQYPYLVLLGGPGSGKSTATKFLAWSHTATNQTTDVATRVPILSGNPIPLRIELRRLSEERKRENYDFLSFATEVLLKRDGVDINPQMFKELLARRCMLLLFDGLDEVTTLEERLELINEIEHFALWYPGNRVLVTSRPVGYELARISHPLFSHAEVQNFNDDQIKQFLENWYTAVLRLSPIPRKEQEELDLLLSALKDNPRLHQLAENPLLLTVITTLHRYERLPDRRVQVYDRCADLLLETWAKLKGTNKRWENMKMIKEDQYACVAYLGFVLHERSQENMVDNDEEADNTTVDVSSRFLINTVEDFLQKRELTIGVIEQRTEAKQFISLIQVEAGLIVERGTDKNGDALYSFVHRTFQEYFAAADIYESYQQEENAEVISKYLADHLHDPHWKEVTFLLLGKLKSKPVTNQLRQILTGETKSKRSQGTDILQQDLFFICDCLLDEINVVISLAERVTASLSSVVSSSPFRGQRKEALEYLGKLMQTRQYKEQGRNELTALATRENSLNIAIKLDVAQTLYLYSSDLTKERQFATSILTSLLQRPELSIDQAWQTAQSLYSSSPKGSEARQFATSILTSLLQRPELSIDQAWETAQSLYYRIPEDSKTQQLATSILTNLLQRPELSIDQTRLIAQSLYSSSPKGSEAQQFTTFILTNLLQRPELSIDQAWQTAESLYDLSSEGSETQQLATSMLTSLLQRPELSIDQTRLIAQSLYSSSLEGSEAQQLATSMLTNLLQRPELSIDQTRLIARSLYSSSPKGSEAQQLATSMLTNLLQRPELSIDQAWQTAQSLYSSSPKGSEAEQLATSMLTNLLQRPELSIDQAWQTAQSLFYNISPEGSEAQQLATSMLTSLLQRPELSIDQTRLIAQLLYTSSSPEDSKARQLVTSMLTSLLQRPELSIDQTSLIAQTLYYSSPIGSDSELFATSILLSSLLHGNISDNINEVYNILNRMIPQFHKLPSIDTHAD